MKAGLPVGAAAATLGFTLRTVQTWMTMGFNKMNTPPEKPQRNAQIIELEGERHCTALEFYTYECNCLALALTVLRTEGALVSGLVKRMWKSSLKNPEMMKFLFKNYGHVHGIAEPKQEVVVREGMPDDEAMPATGLVLYLPHNGREEPTVPIKGKK